MEKILQQILDGQKQLFKGQEQILSYDIHPIFQTAQFSFQTSHPMFQTV